MSSHKSDNLSSFAVKWLEKSLVEHKRLQTDQNKNDTPWNLQANLTKTAWLLGLFQVMLIIFFATMGGKETLNADAYGTGTQGYNMFIGVLIMMLVGFSSLMTFLKWYGLGAMGFVLLITAMGLEWSLFTESFFHQAVGSDPWHKVEINIYSLLNCLYAVSAVLISFGAVIGKITPLQLVIMTIIELVLHSINYIVFMINVMHIADIGGTYIDHMFGAFFGLGVAYMLGRPSSEPDFGTVNDILSLIGTVFLWIYWPSFVVGAATADSEQQERGFVNTIISLSASTVAAFWATLVLSKHKKFRPVDIQNATLAGGVAIGCIANLHITAFDSCMVGTASGIISVIGYNYVQPYLESMLSLHDTCGVLNLHGMPSIIGALASVFIAAFKSDDGRDHDRAIYGEFSGQMWWRQALAIIFCVGFALSTGLIVGYILTLVSPKVNDDGGIEFHDRVWWEVAGDYNKTLYTELALLIDENDIPEAQSDIAISQVLSDFSSHHGRRLPGKATAAIRRNESKEFYTVKQTDSIDVKGSNNV